jgi:nucleoid DNA-binding protein
MTRKEMINTICENLKYSECALSTKKIRMVLDEFEHYVNQLPVGDTLNLKGFGKFAWEQATAGKDDFVLRFYPSK